MSTSRSFLATPPSPSPLSSRLRLLIASSKDADAERKLAEWVVERLAGEFHGRIELEPYFGEYESLRQRRTSQEQSLPANDFDVILGILKSRLGPPMFGFDAEEEISGTGYEVESALADFAPARPPALIFYVNLTPAQFRHLPRPERGQMNRQLETLEDFIQRPCYDRDTGIINGVYTSYRDLNQFEDHLKRHLLKHLLARLPPAAEAFTAASPRSEEIITWHGRPYHGLRAFDFEHAPIFFGRTHATGEVLALLRQRAVRLEEARAAAVSGTTEGIDPFAALFVLVCAMSGVGKSSLVRAGVLPRLTQPGNGIGLWRRVVLRPSETPEGGDLFDALAQELTKPSGLPELLSGGVTQKELAFTLRQNPDGIGALLRQALSQAAESARGAEAARLQEEERRCREAGRLNAVERLGLLRANLTPLPARLAVVIDQLEELFTLEGVTPEMRRRFVQALAALSRSGWVWVIGTLRSDFHARCAELPELLELTAHGLYDLQPPTAYELGQMIRRPAQAAGLHFERHPTTDAPLDEVLRDAALRSPEALPLLAFALDQLYERRTADGLLTWQAYEEIDGLEGALAKAAEEALQVLSPWQEKTFDHVMSGLVTLGSGAQEEVAHRRMADYETLTRPAGAKAFVDRFIEARLFVAHKDTAGRPIVSVAHEALLARKAAPVQAGVNDGLETDNKALRQRPWQWARLGQWVEANADFLRLRARMAASLKQWQDADRDAGFLLPAGRPLLDGETLLRNHPQALSAEEQAYIAQSIAAEAGRRKHRARLRTVLTAGLALLACGAGMGVWFGFRGKREAETQARIAQMQARIAQEKTEEAGKQTGIAEKQAEEAEKQTGIAEKEAAKSQAQLRQSSLSDVVTAKNLINKGNWREAVAYLGRALTQDPGSQPASGGLWRELVYGGGDSDRLPQRLLTHGSKVWSVDYSPDGQRIVAAGAELGKLCYAQQWDAGSGRPFGKPLPHESEVYSAAYSPDGVRIATASEDRTVQQWEAATGQPIGEPLRHQSRVYGAVYSPDGLRLLTACGDQTVRQWDATTGKPVGKTLRHGSGLFDVVHTTANYSPDGQRIVTAYRDGTVQQWEAGTGDPIGKALRHDGEIDDASYSPDGQRILTACSDGLVRQWEAATGKPLGKPLAHESNVLKAAYSPDGQRIITASGGVAQQWDAASGKPIGEPLRHDGMVQSAAYSPDGQHLITASVNAVQQWEAIGGRSVGERTLNEDPLAAWWESHSAQAPPAWLPRLVQVASGYRFTENGELVALKLADRLYLRAQLSEELKGLPAHPEEPWPALARWFMAPAAERTVTPGSTLTVPAFAEQELASGREDAIRNALALAPNLPLVHLALAAYEKDAAHAAFLRRYDLRRLPADAGICARAAAMLRAQNQPPLALQAMEKALAAQPKPDAGLLAPLALTRWLCGDKLAAVRDCQRLLAADGGFADAAKVKASTLPDPDKSALLAALSETIRRHPELAPKPSR